MTGTDRFGNLEHLLQGGDGRSQEDVVIAEAEGTSEVTVDLAAKATLLEEDKEFKAVVTVGKPGEDLALTNPVLDGEARGDLGAPADVGEPVDIHEDDETEEDETQVLHHLTK
jgi:hypothetical protein